MTNKFYINLGAVLIAVLFFISPENSLAAKLIFEQINNNSTVTVNVIVDPESKNINVVDGSIRLETSTNEGLIVDVDKLGSVLPLWPVDPVYNSQDKSITFTGGVPEGFDHKGKLFSITIHNTGSWSARIALVDGAVYVNDGLGTKVTLLSEPVTVISGYSRTENVIILVLVLIILFFVFWYAYRKIIKK